MIEGNGMINDLRFRGNLELEKERGVWVKVGFEEVMEVKDELGGVDMCEKRERRRVEWN